MAQDANPGPSVLITGAKIFAGQNETQAEGMSVLVDGNPLENIDLVADPDKNFVLITKDGKIYKNSL